MSQITSLEDIDDKFRQLIQSLHASNDVCEVKDEDGKTVAVLMSASRYEVYQEYQRQKETDFAIFDNVADAFKDLSSEDLQSRIEQAVDEVKTSSDPQRTTS